MSDPVFTLGNRYVLSLAQWLNNLALVGRESRERTKFVEALNEQLKDIDAMRLEFLCKYAEKDEEGEPKKVTNETGEHFVIPDDKLSEFEKEYADYLNESAFLLAGPGNVQRIKIVKDVVLNTEEKIVGPLANDYSHWCDAFEAVEI